MFPDGGAIFFFMVRPVKVATLMNMNYILYMIYLFIEYTNHYTKLIPGRSETH